MENIKRCCFAGHKDFWDSEAKEKIKRIAEELIINYNTKEFWVGNYGRFDSEALSVIRELQKEYTDIRLELVIPYLTKNINQYNERYYKILVAEIPENTPKRFYITKANEYMINHCDFLICYIQRRWGGAFTTYKYAKRKKLQIFNVAEK